MWTLDVAITVGDAPSLKFECGEVLAHAIVTFSVVSRKDSGMLLRAGVLQKFPSVVDLGNGRLVPVSKKNEVARPYASSELSSFYRVEG